MSGPLCSVGHGAVRWSAEINQLILKRALPCRRWACGPGCSSARRCAAWSGSPGSASAGKSKRSVRTMAHKEHKPIQTKRSEQNTGQLTKSEQKSFQNREAGVENKSGNVIRAWYCAGRCIVAQNYSEPQIRAENQQTKLGRKNIPSQRTEQQDQNAKLFRTWDQNTKRSGHEIRARNDPEHEIRAQNNPEHEIRAQNDPEHEIRAQNDPEHEIRAQNDQEHEIKTEKHSEPRIRSTNLFWHHISVVMHSVQEIGTQNYPEQMVRAENHLRSELI